MHRLLLCFCVCAAFAGTPRSGWVLVPGAEDLVKDGSWGCNSGVAAVSDSLSISAGTAYNTVINSSGPVLKTSGDFSVLATFLASSGGGASLTLVGALNSGSDWWNGLKRLDVGYANHTVFANYWTGGSASSTNQSLGVAVAPDAPVALEVARIGKQIVVFVNGTQAGSFADPGLFDSGQVYLGFNVAPQNTMTVQSLAASMPAGGGVTVFAAYLQAATRSGSALRDLAVPGGMLVGAAVAPAYFAESAYGQAVGREFNVVVPENAMKFAPTEPAPHSFNFCAADQIVAYAETNAMKVRGHTLVWHSGLPSWLTGGNYSPSEAAAILKEHIDTVVGRYKGRVFAWDVVNEAIAYSAPYGAQPSYWLNQLGSGYIDQAFQWAHAADPDVKLFYNDTGGEGLGAKSDAVYNLVKGLVTRGVPMNGVGLQMHVTLKGAPTVSEMSTNIARLAALGLEVHITELDVRVATPASASDLAAEAVVYQNVMTACRANANCTAVLTWGVTDAHSWIPSSYPGFGAGLMLDEQYVPKPAYTAVADVLRLLGATARPVIGTGGVVIHGGTAAVVSPGSLVDIYGSNMARTGGDVQVTVSGSDSPLLYASPEQIVFQMPYEISPGPALVQVTANGVAGSSASITVQQAAPSLLTYGANRAVVQPGTCATPGSVLTAYLIGSGPLDNPVATGAAAPLAPLSREALTTTATLGGVPAPVSFAGLTPGSIGLMQVNFTVPDVSGDLPLRVQIGGFISNSALVCVGK